MPVWDCNLLYRSMVAISSWLDLPFMPVWDCNDQVEMQLLRCSAKLDLPFMPVWDCNYYFIIVCMNLHELFDLPFMPVWDCNIRTIMLGENRGEEGWICLLCPSGIATIRCDAGCYCDAIVGFAFYARLGLQLVGESQEITTAILVGFAFYARLGLQLIAKIPGGKSSRCVGFASFARLGLQLVWILCSTRKVSRSDLPLLPVWDYNITFAPCSDCASSRLELPSFARLKLHLLLLCPEHRSHLDI